MPINFKLLKPKVEKMTGVFLAECKKQGLEIFVTQGMRTLSEQAALYAKGRRGIKGERVVTNAKAGQSNHNYGCAIDIAFKGPTMYPPLSDPRWKAVAAIGKKIGFSWGGDWWWFKDYPHFEYTAGYSLRDFQTGRIDESKFSDTRRVRYQITAPKFLAQYRGDQVENMGGKIVLKDGVVPLPGTTRTITM